MLTQVNGATRLILSSKSSEILVAAVGENKFNGEALLLLLL